MSRLIKVILNNFLGMGNGWGKAPLTRALRLAVSPPQKKERIIIT
jgi:hypothetical protein